MKLTDDNVPIVPEDEKAILFWNWFSENQSEFLFSSGVNSKTSARFIEQLSAQLDKYNPGLFFEIGKKPYEDKMQFVITAAGNVSHFADVEFLYSKAPVFDNWEIIAFKPPMGVGFKLHYRGIELNPETIIFIPFDSKEMPNAVGLHICFDQLDKTNRETLIGGTYLVLDSILGEKATALDIDYLEIIKTPPNIEAYDYKYLHQIASFIKEKKKLTKQL